MEEGEQGRYERKIGANEDEREERAADPSTLPSFSLCHIGGCNRCASEHSEYWF